MGLKIAILGLRGIPSTYSGYETIIGELAPRFVKQGHEVTVYCRRELFKERPALYQGIHLKYLPSIEHKALSTLSHTALAITQASLGRFDIILVVNAANGLFGFIPRLFGKKCVLNVDGMEWLRPKWDKVGRWVFRNSAWLGTRFYHEIITDADEMHRLYAREFGIDSTYIAYGANIEESTQPDVVRQYGLEPRNYYLIASRLVPDNNADVIVDAFVRSGSKKILAIAGGADYRGNTIEQQFIDKLKALANDRVKFLGHVNSSEHIKELHCNCFAYIHGHQFGGINPSLLKALGFGNAIFALNTPFNAEVLDNGQYGILFNKDATHLAELLRRHEADDSALRTFRSIARERIRERFTWDRIADEYEQLFKQLHQGRLN
jgi:glycosyltransferase involved in cell wall biosynthesis